MNQEAIRTWLKHKKTSGTTSRRLLALVALIGCVVVLFLTFWFTYAVIWFGMKGISALSLLAFSQRLNLPHEWRLILSGVFITLLFIQHHRTNPWHWGNYPERDYVPAPGFQARAGVVGALGFMLAYPGASANMIADILLSGPRLFSSALNFWQESRRMASLDEEFCSQLLAFLASRSSAVSYDDLHEAGWQEWIQQLRCIEGVVFLKKGIALNGELRQEIAALKPA